MNATTSDVNSARLIFGMTLIGLFDVVFMTVFAVITMITIDFTVAMCSLGILLIFPML